VGRTLKQGQRATAWASHGDHDGQRGVDLLWGLGGGGGSVKSERLFQIR
jgi:hypothetical protein